MLGNPIGIVFIDGGGGGTSPLEDNFNEESIIFLNSLGSMMELAT